MILILPGCDGIQHFAVLTFLLTGNLNSTITKTEKQIFYIHGSLFLKKLLKNSRPKRASPGKNRK
jgi:hypothetical protein